MNRSSKTRWLPVLLLLAGGAAYANSLNTPFLLDDHPHIVNNGAIQSLWPPGSLLTSGRRPVAVLSIALNYAVGGLDTFGYHLVNLAIHLAAGLALFSLVRRTLALVPSDAAKEKTAENTADRLAFAVALVWLVHPLTTQSVTYVIQRAESLMGLFYLLTLVCLLRGAQAARSWPWYTAAVAVCWLGMGSKEVMVTAPLVALAYDRIFLADTWRTLFRRRWAVYTGFLIAAVWIVTAAGRTMAAVEARTAGFGMPSATPWKYLTAQAGVILHYLRLAFWPDRLCLDYAWQLPESTAQIVLPGAIVVALLAASLVALRYRPPLGFLGLSFFLILAPTSSIMPIADLAMEHRMYLPLAALVTLAVLGLHVLAGRLTAGPHMKTLIETSLLVIVAIALAARTFDRNLDYASPIAMWNDVLDTAPHNARAHYGLGVAVADRGDLRQAAIHYDRALEIAPDYVDVIANLADLRIKEGKLGEALDHYRRALEIAPDFARAHNNLGNLLTSQGDHAGAADHFRHALRIDPRFSEAHNNLGNFLEHEGRLDEAATHYQEAIRFKPDHVEAHTNLGVVLQQQGDLAQAVVHYEHSLALRPGFAEAHLNLGNVLLMQGDDTQAAEHLQQAIRLKPDLAQAYAAMGDVHRLQGDLREAVAQYRESLRLEPNLLRAMHTLAWILATSDDPTVRGGEEAVGWAERLATATAHKDPTALDTLAAAYAEAGRWDESIATARTARRLATAAGSTAEAEQIRLRLQLYRQQKPYRAGLAK